MAANIDDLANVLSLTKVSESGVSFAGKSLKLNTEEDAKQVTDEIDKCKSLQYLNMEGNTLGVDAAKAIGKSLEKHPEFKRALWKDMFTGRMKTEIPKALQFLGDGLVKAGSRLTELDMSDNAFGPIGVEGLASLIRSASCFALEELRLNNNGLGITGGKLLATALTDCYNQSKNQGKPLRLRVFIAGRNRLENEGAKALAEVFKMIGTLEEVAMPQNGIYHPGITALSEAFNNNKSLKILNLNDNTIGPKGAEALATALPNLQNLKEINFGDCLLKTKGATVLAKALKDKHENLEQLTLGFNEIRKEGGIAVVEALGNKPKLKNVILDGNQFGDDGCDEIKKNFAKIGKYDASLSLEEDEGDDDADEEEEEEEEEAEIESDDESTNVTFDQFIQNPTEDKFINLGHERKNFILKESKKGGDIVLKDFITVLMKVSSLYGSKREMVRNYALDVTESLYKELFNWAATKQNSPYVFNAIFVNLGLIKCEDKSFSPTWDCKACQNALKALKNNNCVPQTVKNILDVFFAHTENGECK
ncbi:ran GTPase-activating protein 1 [Coccinella septempunctata]|uniref:ran GTPase-activating protein 1 n=1 Tax=Coccinella septempunctata TaxID=41139 RepID=UPI001D09984E|nr:ran GTPase-activating protein 1 [Coccinella septempunctata]